MGDDSVTTVTGFRKMMRTEVILKREIEKVRQLV